MIFNLKNIINGKKKFIAIDVGCRGGDLPKINGHLDEVQVYGFDPDEKECERLNEHYKGHSIFFVPQALCDKVQDKLIYITREPACSSFYKPIKHFYKLYPGMMVTEEIDQTSISVTTSDQQCLENNINKIDYLKIDTQGYELNVLKGSVGSLKNIRFLDIEVEFNQMYENQPIFSEVDLFLRNHGFELWKFNNIVHYGINNEADKEILTLSIHYDEHRNEINSRGGQIFWADAKYIKKEIIHCHTGDLTTHQRNRDIRMAEILKLDDIADRLKKYK